MKITKTRFSELDENQLKRIQNLTIQDSSFLRYLHSYIDTQSPEHDKTIMLAQGQDIVGWTLIGVDEDFGFGEEGMVHLFVDSSMRGEGLGLQLFEQAVEEIKLSGINKILTYAHDEGSYKFFNSEKVKALCESKGVNMEVIN